MLGLLGYVLGELGGVVTFMRYAKNINDMPDNENNTLLSWHSYLFSI